MATWFCKWSFTATQPHLCAYPLSVAVSQYLEVSSSYNTMWPTGPKYLLSDPLQILIPDLKDSQSDVNYKKKKKKKINAINQMSLQNRKIFYFLYYTFSGLAKDQNSPLGHHHLRFNLPPISKSTVKSKIILYRMVPMMSWHLLLLWHELTGQKKGDASEMNIIKWIKKRTKECTTRYICEGGSLTSLS